MSGDHASRRLHARWVLVGAMACAVALGVAVLLGNHSTSSVLASSTPEGRAAGAPACAPPSVTTQPAISGAVAAGKSITIDARAEFVTEGATIQSVDVIVGDESSTSDVEQLQSGSSHVLARTAVDLHQASSTPSFSISVTSVQTGQLPTFALIHYAPSNACGGGEGWVAQPLGTIATS